MAWIPSTNHSLQKDLPNPFWSAIEGVFDNAIPLEPLPRGDFPQLDSFYVRDRKGDILNISELESRLPLELTQVSFGATDLDLLDFIISSATPRLMRLIGPRGAGKTTMLHFSEAALRRCRTEPMPHLVMLDGLRCPDEASMEDLLALLRDGLEEVASSIDGPMAEALREASVALGGDLKLTSVGPIFTRLRARLPQKDERQILLVFDNLDQLKLSAISRVLDVVKSIYTTSRIGSIICLRPGSEAYLSRTATASAFFFYRMEVQTPRFDAWVERLIPRISSTVEDEYRGRGRYPEVEGVVLTGEVLAKSFTRFVQILREQRREDDDVFEVLEAVSANDTRHLVRLFRRLLKAPNLPYRWLLGIEEERPSFHPLTGLIAGPKVFYTHNIELPNLLFFTASSFGIDYLLPHRILRLLASSRNPIATERLLQWMMQFGSYDVDGVVECLGMLIQSHVIAATDGETISVEEPLPSGLLLTDAGRYYIEKLLHYTDYLAAVVMDVPLEHTLLREQNYDSFGARLGSLMEYAAVVRDAEARQLRELTRRGTGSELARVVQSLSNGGLLTTAVHTGLSNALSRGRTSRSQHLQDVLAKVEKMLSELDHWLLGAEKTLRELRNKAGRSIPVPAQPLLIGEEGVEAQLNVRSVGEDLQMSVEVRGEVEGDTFIAVTASNLASGDFLQATPLKPRMTSRGSDLPGVLKADFPDITPGFELARDTVHLQVLSAPQSVDRVGLLTIDEDNGRARIRLYSGYDDIDNELGTVVQMQALKHWATEQLSLISGRVTAGKPFNDDLRVLGTELCSRALSPDGARKLASAYNLLDTVVLCCNETEIPWELMCPPPTSTGILPSVGDVWRVFRWPADPLDGAVRYRISDPRSPAGSIRTLGLDPGMASNGHIESTPSNVRDLAEVAAKCDSLHIVGHWENGSLHFTGSDFTLTGELVRAFAIPGARNVIISSCGAGAIEKSSSLPVALSLRSNGRRIVWSPIVQIRAQDAFEIDAYLSSFANAYPNVPMEEIIRDGRTTLPLLSLYVRYGLSRA
jgi:hypothetical protein